MDDRGSGSTRRVVHGIEPAHPSGGASAGTESYNRSSLALDFQNSAALQWKSAPRWVSSPRALPAAGSGEFIWKGLALPESKRSGNSTVVSFVVHVLAISGAIWWGVTSHVQIMEPKSSEVTKVDFKLYDPPPPVMPVAKTEGGGGGTHELPLPRRAPVPRVLKVQPALPKIETVHMQPAQLRIDNPKLPMPASSVNMQETAAVPTFGVSQQPQVALSQRGNSSGAGLSHGLGGGLGMGVGSGPGGGGGYGGGLMSVGGGVSAPQVIHSVEPEFTEEARRADYEGSVAIQLIVDSQGNPQDVRIVHHLGMGLDARAIAAVRQYKFKPALYQGHPVAVQMVIEVGFHLH